MDGLNFSLEDAVEHFGYREIGKGREYLNRVNLESITNNVLIALVQGTAPHPYRVAIHFAGGRMLSNCSCPVGVRCKHGAATALVVLDIRYSDPDSVVRSNTQEWLYQVERSIQASLPQKTRPNTQQLIWKIYPREGWLPARLQVFKTRLRVNGQPGGTVEPWSNFNNALRSPAGFVSTSDLDAIKTLLLGSSGAPGLQRDYLNVEGLHATSALELLANAGSLWSGPDEVGPLHLGEPRLGVLTWKVLRTGEQMPCLDFGSRSSWSLAADGELFYVDPEACEIGTIITEQPTRIVSAIMRGPALNSAEAKRTRELLKDAMAGQSLPSEDPIKELPTIAPPFIPALILRSVPLPRYSPRWTFPDGVDTIEIAQVELRYGDIVVEMNDDSVIVETESQGTVVLVRDEQAEQKALNELETTMILEIHQSLVMELTEITSQVAFGFSDPEGWHEFMTRYVPWLRSEGWQIEIDPQFRHYQSIVSSWHVDIGSSQTGWFDLELGITVDGQRLDLAELLTDLLEREPRWLTPGGLAGIDDDEVVLLQQPGFPKITVEAGRLKRIVGTLIDLFSRKSATLRLSAYDAGRVKTLLEGDSWDTTGLDHVLELASSRLTGDGPSQVEPPNGLKAVLRPYQIDGISWLQFLREHDFGGILADDMGLGKTLQTLAHILLEKEAGRLQAPVLIVVPTSLINTWTDEAVRFTPDLRVLALHGPGRAHHFTTIADHDVILTTYALVWRDIAILGAHRYHMVVLDEAQNVKNPIAKASIAIRKLDTTHRLCLSGTPIENHLLELWSQFDMLLPGFLGERGAFKEIWATPVEVHNDRARLDILAKRVRPFILRRTKAEVAADLPPKTVIIETVEMERAQHDLYESVRATMDQRVRDEINSRGIDQSHIIILDALLKLRQVCCDPRLLKSTTARKTRKSAKLTALLEMIPELLEEGRRILLFSQFTEMLDIIAAELAHRKLPFVTLRGDTRDRKTPVDRFQAGEVPLFLISLKAGGVGLNLTAADTVIHYDPWWNPAAEDQATDRAHRIGQTKSVFVYKLIVAGSIEEKIISLQSRKAQLAAGILDEARSSSVKFGAEDIVNLLSPLPTRA